MYMRFLEVTFSREIQRLCTNHTFHSRKGLTSRYVQEMKSCALSTQEMNIHVRGEKVRGEKDFLIPEFEKGQQWTVIQYPRPPTPPRITCSYCPSRLLRLVSIFFLFSISMFVVLVWLYFRVLEVIICFSCYYIILFCDMSTLFPETRVYYFCMFCYIKFFFCFPFHSMIIFVFIFYFVFCYVLWYLLCVFFFVCTRHLVCHIVFFWRFHFYFLL